MINHTSKILSGLVVSLVGVVSLQRTVLADTIDPQSIEEWLNPTVSYEDIWDAIRDGDVAYTLKLAGDLVYQKLRQTLNDEKKLPVIVGKAVEGLQAILDDDSKTDETKADEVAALIDSMLAPYESEPTGQLNLTLRHALDTGVTRLTWDRAIEVDDCSVYVLTAMYCEDDYGFYYQCGYDYVYQEKYVYKQPDYYIYREVNGQEKLVTKLVGDQQISSNTLFDTSNPWKTAKGIYNFYNNNIDVDDSRAFFYDLNADVRNAGDTLSYRIVADNNAQQAGDCGTSEIKTSIVTADADGDGRMDYIPDAEYQALFGKYYGWLVPVITILSN